ncbi:MAG: sulfatase [bacterium]
MSKKPNIVLIVLDTTRATNLSCYGYSKQTSPNLDKISEEGVLFTNAISNSSWTLPAHASLFTGTFPSVHSVNEWTDRLPDHLVTMAQFFSNQDYQTVAINNNSWINEQFGLDRGFKVVKKIWLLLQTSNDLNVTSRSIKNVNLFKKICKVSKNVFRGNLLLNLVNGVYGQFLHNRHDLGGKRILKAFEKWFHTERNTEKPFFLFMNLLEPHLPYTPPRQCLSRFFDGKFSDKQIEGLNQDPFPYVVGIEKKSALDLEILTALYDAEINYLDSLIASIYNILYQTNHLDNTILIIVGDHGENLGEHGLMSHFFCLYDTLIHIPLIIRFPSAFSKASKNENIVQLSDLFPSLAALAGLENHLPHEQIEGRNIFASDLNDRIAVSELLGTNPPLEVIAKKTGIPEVNLARLNKKIVAFRNKKYKFIEDSLGNEEFYNIVEDPRELNNLIDKNPKTLAQFKRFKEYWGSRKVVGEKSRQANESSKLEKETFKRLKALGYL